MRLSNNSMQHLVAVLMCCNSSTIWDSSYVCAVFYRTNPSVQLGLFTAEGQTVILNNLWYYIQPSTDVHGIGHQAPSHTLRFHNDISISTNISFIHVQHYVFVFTADSRNKNTNPSQRQTPASHSIQMRIL